MARAISARKLLGVARLSHRARGYRVDANRAELTGERRHAVERLECGADRKRGQFARGAEPRREARRRLHLVHDLDRSLGRDIGDDLPNRVRAYVDRGDTTMSRS